MSSPRRVLVMLVVAYASLYLCRANVEPAWNLLAVEHGYDNEKTGTVFAIALAAYAIGKIVLGAVGDRIGGKNILVAAMTTAVIATLLSGAIDWPAVFGAGPALWIMGTLVVLNRFGQSGAWGGLLHVVARWFPSARVGAVMGIASASYDIGNVVTLALCAGLVALGLGWRALFVVNPILLGLVTIVTVFALRASPSETAAETKEADEVDRERFASTVRRLARERAFWIAIGLSFLLTFVRAGFMTWTPRYLYEVAAAAGSTSALSGSIAKSTFFGIAGMVGSMSTGALSDRAGPGKRGGIMSASLACLLAAVLVLAHVKMTHPLGAAAVIGLAGLFLLGPYSLPAGAVTLDLAGKRGTATVAGIVDGAGYAGASLSAFVLGSLSKRYSWSIAFDVVAGVVAAALVLAFVWWRGARMTRRST
ncbi:MAG: MFS transporter [Labilithrix sp.]|nr:MFS transporter [Labilithrix sp.]